MSLLVRRRLAPPLIALLALGVAVTTSARRAAADTVTSYTVNHDVPITMDDGIVLDSDEYVPTTGCPCPVILIQTPYKKSNSQVAEANPYFPSHGYAEIVVDVRGTGSSEGYWDSFGPREQKDSVALVQWAAARAFSDGNVGLAGVSYSGINQLLTVEQPGTSAVKAIFPIVPMSDSYRDVTWAGGNTDAGFIPLWLGLVNGLAVVPGDETGSNPGVALNAESQHLYDLAQFMAPVLADATLGSYEGALPAQVQTYPDQSYDGQFYRVRSPIDRIDQVQVPTFILGGEYDLFQRGEPVLYNGLSLPATQKKLLIGPWYHDTEGSTLPAQDTSGNAIPDQNALQLAWFDHWLKGVDNGIDHLPNVETYQIGSGKWIPSSSYPAPGTGYERWYLGPGAAGGGSLYAGTLSTQAPLADGSATVPWTVNGACSRSTDQWTAGIAASGSQPPPCDSNNNLTEAQALTFTSAPFTTPYAIEGPMDAHVTLSSTRPDTSIIVTVTDVGPDGTSNPVTAGSLVASLRALTTTRCGNVVLDCSVYAGHDVVQPWHPYTKDSQSPLNPGTLYSADVEIFPTSMVLEPGHRLRVDITSSDVPHETSTASTTVDSAGAATTYYFGPSNPSWLYAGSPGQ